MTYTNIKNLPEGVYFTEIGYSQQYPWALVSSTAKAVTLARVLVEADPEWLAKKEFMAGGFFGHCPNQHQQTWLFGFVNENDLITVRKTKRGWMHKGRRFVEGRAVEFYDYNF